MDDHRHHDHEHHDHEHHGHGHHEHGHHEHGHHGHGHHERGPGHGEGHRHSEHNECCGEGGSRREQRDDGHHYQEGRREGGPDTRFLQLELSQVLYGQAECCARQAFQDLLLEAAKVRLRERFGDKITGLAELAVDELMADGLVSLEVEARIQTRNRERGRFGDRLRDIFTGRGPGGEGGSGHEEGGGGSGHQGNQ